MPKNKTASRLKKLLAANVNFNKANILCHLTWPEIWKIHPELNSTVPETSLNPPLQKKKKYGPSVRVQEVPEVNETFPWKNEPDPAQSWHQPCNLRQSLRDRATRPNYSDEQNHLLENETSHESMLFHPKETLLPKYGLEAGPSEMRKYENRRDQSPSDGEPPIKVPKKLHVDLGLPNCRKRKHSPIRHPDATPMDLEPDNQVQLKYIDADDALQVQVQNGMRAVKRQYCEGSDGSSFSEQPCKTLKTSPESHASQNYWPDLDQPSRFELQNETREYASTLSYSDDKSMEDTQDYQEISWKNNINVDYREPHLPSREGLWKETHPMTDDDSDEEYLGPPKKLYNPINKDYPFKSEIKSEKDIIRNNIPKTQEPFPKNDKNLTKDTNPICVGIQNITPMTKKQKMLVHQAVNQAIVRIGVQGAGPTFLGSTYQEGWMIMICENYKSLKWLVKNIPALKPWPGAELSIMTHNESSKPIQISVLIPSKEGVSITTALELLRVQNPGLNTDNWKVEKVRTTYTGKIVILSINEASYEALRLLDFQANLGIDKVTFWTKSGKRFVNPVMKTPAGSSASERQKELPCTDEKGITKTKENRARKARRLRSRNRKALSQLNQDLMQKEKEISPLSNNFCPSTEQPSSSSDWVTW